MKRNVKTQSNRESSRKKVRRISMLCLTALMLSACEKVNVGEDEDIRIVESEPIGDTGGREMAGENPEEKGIVDESAGALDGAPGTESTETAELKTEADRFVGEYNGYDTEEPDLEIQKGEDETYQIHISIFRLASFDDGVGALTEKGLEFTATAPDGEETDGVITLDGDVATVTFEPGWSGFEGIYSFQYYKTSDTPNMDLSVY